MVAESEIIKLRNNKFKQKKNSSIKTHKQMTSKNESKMRYKSILLIA